MFIKIIVKLNDLLHKFVQKASRKTLNRCNLDIDRKFFAEVCLWNVSLFLLLWNTHQPHHQASKWKYICFELGACSMDLIYSFFLYIHINFVSVNPLAPMKKKDVAFHIDFSPFFSGIWFIQPDNQNAELSSWMDFNVWGFIYTLGSSHQIAERERKRKRECEHKKKNQQRRAQFQNLFLSVVTLHNADFFLRLSCTLMRTSNASLPIGIVVIASVNILQFMYVIPLDILPCFCQTIRHILSDIITDNMK